ncbi:hypothetical protein GCM10010339_70750 [Streptomyces alanosinicus]|uniref:Uncharacterized protein n=1 Tax=Streptomyces alanosinicus TaxID=68171 RepID=A0A918YRR7_9ACTN|nr:hypothetical protein GCM10010339_70750 [Streptomyces alanosinicus]
MSVSAIPTTKTPAVSGMRRLLTNTDEITVLLEGLDVPIELTGQILHGPKDPATSDGHG